MSDQDLYEQLAEGINAKGSEIITKIFRKLATPEEARLLLAASPPKSAAELASELGLNIVQYRQQRTFAGLMRSYNLADTILICHAFNLSACQPTCSAMKVEMK